MATKEELLKELSDCVLDLRDDEVADVAQQYIDEGYNAYDGIFYGLVDGMNKAAQLYEEEEYFEEDWDEEYDEESDDNHREEEW